MASTPQLHGRYEQMLAGSATAAICAGRDNLIVSWNAGAEALFGYSPEEAVGRPLSLIVPPGHRAAHEAGLARAAVAGHARLAGKAVEILALHKSGHEIPVDLSLSMWTEAGQPMFGALLRDVSDRQAAQRRLEHLAHCDTLTSLPNRNALQARLSAEMDKGPCALLLLDLDGFKHVNDTLGHSIGDQLLAAVARRLSGAAPTNMVARLGGDEFAILLPGDTDPLKLDLVAASILKALQRPFELAGQSIFVDTSIGIATSPRNGVSVEQLMSNADLALYAAKERGGGARMFFARRMQDRSEQRHRLNAELRRAFAHGEFELWYQPQVALRDIGSAISGVEALLRWRHPERGVLLPSAFMHVLEDSTLAADVGSWILEQACADLARWRRLGAPTLRMSVNLFPVQLSSGQLFTSLSEILIREELSPQMLELEITENTVLRHDKHAARNLRKLKASGIGVAFDDFGTGYASLSLLQKHPLTRIKIDRSFVARVDRSSSDAAIVRALVGMAQNLGISVIAEGVETVAQEAALRAIGCREAQGFLYGQAMSSDDLLRTLTSASAVARFGS